MKTLALRARVFIHCFLVFGYPGETLALVVHILLLNCVYPNPPCQLSLWEETRAPGENLNCMTFGRALTVSFHMSP